MKAIIVSLLLFTSFATVAQKKELYFDFRWKPCEPSVARYYAVVEKKDSLWHRLDYFINEKTVQMEGSFRDADCTVEEGPFTYYHSNGVIESAGMYKNGKRHGPWFRYYDNKMISDSVTYDNGNVVGTRLQWHRNGYLLDSSSWSPDGNGTQVSWFDNGNPSAAGRYVAGEKRHGKWQFFHRNGNISAMEVYNSGQLASRAYYDEGGRQISDTTNKDREADFPGGMKAWQKYLQKNLYFPPKWQFKNDGQAIVLVDWAIDEEGNVTDVRVTGSLHPEFDKIAVDVIRKSPKWIPAVDHNRKIKAFCRQPVTFVQQ